MSNKHSGWVWILSAFALLIYAGLAFFEKGVPGVEDLVKYIASIDGIYIFIAAFLSILIEGLYVIGSFFPGSSLVVILAILSQTSGSKTFLLTILAIFLGWCLAGMINVFIAKIYKSKILKQIHDKDYLIVDRPLTTWFPAFRANYEVAQIVEGGDSIKVLLSSFRVKFFVSLIMMGITFLMPFILDINEVSNEDGLITVIIVAIISFIVGVIKIKNHSETKSF